MTTDGTGAGAANGNLMHPRTCERALAGEKALWATSIHPISQSMEHSAAVWLAVPFTVVLGQPSISNIHG